MDSRLYSRPGMIKYGTTASDNKLNFKMTFLVYVTCMHLFIDYITIFLTPFLFFKKPSMVDERRNSSQTEALLKVRIKKLKVHECFSYKRISLAQLAEAIRTVMLF